MKDCLSLRGDTCNNSKIVIISKILKKSLPQVNKVVHRSLKRCGYNILEFYYFSKIMKTACVLVVCKIEYHAFVPPLFFITW